MQRAAQSCSRAVSPLLQRHATRTSPITFASEMSTSSSSKDTKVPKKAPKPKKDPCPPVREPEEPYQGDEYKAGQTFFSHKQYTFYDVENNMQPERCPQPSSDKMYQFCLDKLNPADEDDSRKLLVESHGDLEEYPNKPESKKKEKPAASVMTIKYPVEPQPEVYDGNSLKSRMPI